MNMELETKTFRRLEDASYSLDRMVALFLMMWDYLDELPDGRVYKNLDTLIYTAVTCRDEIANAIDEVVGISYDKQQKPPAKLALRQADRNKP